jgi:hypothetical protein
MFEVLSALVVYSRATVADKMALLFRLFDAEGGKAFRYEEIFAAVKVMIGGISRMTSAPHLPKRQIETLTEKVMAGCDVVSYAQITDYIATTELHALMKKYEPKRAVRVSKLDISSPIG